MNSDFNNSEGITYVGQELMAGRIAARLATLVGGDKAFEIYNECMDEANLNGIRSSQDMLRFSRVLAKRGGQVEELARELMQEVLESIMRQASTKLASAMGAEKTQQVIKECLAEAGLKEINTPQDLLSFSTCMINRGGITKVIGHSLKIQALLDGAGQ